MAGLTFTKPEHRGEIYDGPDRNGKWHVAVFWMACWPPNTYLEKDWNWEWYEAGQHFRVADAKVRWPGLRFVDKRFDQRVPWDR